VEQYKTCTKCGQIKNLSEFYKRLASKDGLRSSCADCDKLYKKTKSLESKKRDSARASSWNKNNQERRSEIRKKSERKNSENAKRSARESYKKNRDKRLALGKVMRDMKSPAEKRLKTLKARARKRGCEVFLVTPKELAKIIQRPCMYCGLKGPSEIDHLIPLEKRGSHSLGNLVPACRSCNASKSDSFYFQWKLKR
jgi:5-methylcytosine-specific restriction endonuclease McrA